MQMGLYLHRRISRRCSARSEEHTSELQSLAYLVCRLLLEKKKLQEAAPPRRRPPTRCAMCGSRNTWPPTTTLTRTTHAPQARTHPHAGPCTHNFEPSRSCL